MLDYRYGILSHCDSANDYHYPSDYDAGGDYGCHCVTSNGIGSESVNRNDDWTHESHCDS